MAHRTYLIWYNKPEMVPYPIVILEDGIAVSNVHAVLSYQARPGRAEMIPRDGYDMAYTERNVNEKTWKSLSRCEARKFMRKHYPNFDIKLL